MQYLEKYMILEQPQVGSPYLEGKDILWLLPQPRLGSLGNEEWSCTGMAPDYVR